MNSTVPITGRGKYPRAIRELQQEAMRARPGFVPGALVSITARGVLVQPDVSASNATAAPRQPQTQVPRWG